MITGYSDAVPQTARAIVSATLDSYEAAARALTELEWDLGRRAAYKPLAFLATASAETTRDLAAVQLSAIRWCLDL